MVKISIVIPIYNMERYLVQCLESILSQTLSDIELVCVDDGSTDQSEQIIKDFAQKDTRIKLITQENQGVGIARNNGIRFATGKYIAFMDPDDYYLDNAVLMELYSAAEQNAVLICGGSLCEDHGDGRWFRKKFRGSFVNYTFKKDGYVSYRDYQYDYGFYRFIYDREFLINNNIFFPDYIRFQDPPFFVHAMLCAEGFWALSRITYCYRCGHQNFKWNEKRICALVSGLKDNLKMSKEAKLPELHRLTMERILFDFKEPILMGMQAQSQKVLKLLDEMSGYIEDEYVKDDVDYQRGLAPLFDEYRRISLRHKGEKLNPYQSSKKTIPGRIVNRIRVCFRRMRRGILQKRTY